MRLDATADRVEGGSYRAHHADRVEREAIELPISRPCSGTYMYIRLSVLDGMSSPTAAVAAAAAAAED